MRVSRFTIRFFAILLTVLLSGTLISCSSTEATGQQGAEELASTADFETILTGIGGKPAVESVFTNGAPKNEVKAVWIAYMDLEKAFSSRTAAAFTTEISKMFQNCVDAGLNTVIVQVRPYSDSFYPSTYFPWSNYVSGTMGKAAGYDPLKLMVDEAHQAGLSIEAWINPFRGMTTAQIGSVPDTYSIRKWYDNKDKFAENLFTVQDRIYYNPASQEVRDLIAAGAVEIAKNYQVDGIHIDDYFYPANLPMSVDNIQYSAYQKSGGKLSQADWRRDNTSKMVEQLYSAVKAANSKLRFGVSPRGINSQSHDELFADVAKWVSTPGYLDYVAPQIYYGFEHPSADYRAVLAEWDDLVTLDSVELLVGLAAYKVGAVDTYAGSAKNEWLKGSNIIAMQIDEARSYRKCNGVILFRYGQIFEPSSDIAPAMKIERKNFISLLQ